MKNADVVIGANLGDEGKGLLTDYLAAGYGRDALVVRFCGGAQAGHTVTAPDGRRHVFKHFGSGSFCESATYLSRFFVCNPILFLAEAALLAKWNMRPKVCVDPAAPVTTPYDMMINQMVEELRGSRRHGSCGVGFGETLERQQYGEYALCFADLYNTPKLKAKLELIRSQWVPVRLKELGIHNMSKAWEENFRSSTIFNHFLQDTEAFLDHVRAATVQVIANARHVVFEGSQGLLLDQDHEWFPHVTRSNTGLKNVAVLAKAAGIDELTAHYASRGYATRHGAGPLPHELSNKPYKGIVDLTNVPNPYQGTLRFGWLDLDLLKATIESDLTFAPGICVTPKLALTCIDQIDGKAGFVHDGIECKESLSTFLATASRLIPGAKLLTSHGPTRTTMEKFTHIEVACVTQSQGFARFPADVRALAI